MWKCVASLVVLAVLVSACAPKSVRPKIDPQMAAEEADRQRKMVVESHLTMLKRVDDVGVNLLIKNAPLCENKTYAIGMRVTNIHKVDDRDWRAAYEKHAGLGDFLTAVTVTEGGPAWKAGIRPGDRILTVDRVQAPSGERAVDEWPSAAKTFLEGNGALVEVARGDTTREFYVEPERACNYPVNLVLSPVVNAFANGKQITVLSGLVEFTKNDDELALIVGHELAHNALEHIEAKKGNRALGSLFGGIVQIFTGVPVGGIFAEMGQMAFSKEFELEADYVGLYYTTRAGYKIEGVADFWRRMAVKSPGAISQGLSHPAMADRFVAMESTVAEIRKKQEAGEQLVPNMRPE